MRLEEIQDHVDRTPFRPFRVWLSSGEHHDVASPNLVFLTPARLTIGFLEGGQRWPERVAYCDPRHITQIEVLEHAED